MTDIVPPVLSSEQEEQFKFDKFDTNLNSRTYLGPNLGSESLKDVIRDYYSIDKLINFLQIHDNGAPRYKSITLQFPDDLITDSAIIVQMLQEGLSNKTNEIDMNSCDDEDIEVVHKPCTDKKDGACTCGKKTETTGQKVWILADTSYSPCCIDEVAAEHVLADIVIHFGDACLNRIEKLPAVYVFGKPFLNHELVLQNFKTTFTDHNTKICLMADTCFSYHLPKLFESLIIEYPNLVYSDVPNLNDAIIIDHVSSQDDNTKVSNRLIYNLDGDTQDYEIFHINLPPPPRLLELSTKFSTITTYDTITNKISQGPYPSLMKRYRFMHIARTAGTIGILVNTLSLSNTKKLLNSVAKWIKDAGKKHYMFVVGKPNVAKLANFESIDIWCVLGCGQNGIIIDNVGDYYKPIITPYELQMALSDELTWTGNWIVDFNQVLSLQDDEKKSYETEKDDDAPEFDPVTGKYVSNSRPLRRYVQHLEIGAAAEEEEKSLVKKFSSLVAIKGTVSTSAVTLQNRHWTGLGSDFATLDDEEGAVVEEGRGGVARGYDFDRENNNI